jgi:hypothetical protein
MGPSNDKTHRAAVLRCEQSLHLVDSALEPIGSEVLDQPEHSALEVLLKASRQIAGKVAPIGRIALRQVSVEAWTERWCARVHGSSTPIASARTKKDYRLKVDDCLHRSCGEGLLINGEAAHPMAGERVGL